MLFNDININYNSKKIISSVILIILYLYLFKI